MRQKKLRPVEPLKGVSDHAMVRVLIETGEAFDPLARLAVLNGATADTEQMLAEIAAGTGDRVYRPERCRR